jgi:hypothetical protein
MDLSMHTVKLIVLCAGVLCGSPLLAAPSSSPLSAPIIGRVPTATNPVIINLTAPGMNPAQGDQLKATYVYTDPDHDLVDPAKSVYSWSANGAAISAATTDTFTPTVAQNKKFLSFAVTPASMPPADPSKATVPANSPNSSAPVLPSRTQLANEFIKAPNNMRWGDAYMYCANQGERLPTSAELQTLFTTYTRANAVGEDSQRDIVNTYGWPGGVHWTSYGNDSTHSYVYIQEDGRVVGNSNSNTYPFACIKAGAAEGLPTVSGVSIPSAKVGAPVTASYTYNGNATIPDRSRFQWFTATAANGTTGKALIAGATTSTYTPSPADIGKWPVIEITPASYDSVVGSKVTAVSATAVIATPQVSNVSISGYDQWGTPQIGGTLKGEYTFDANGGSADASTYRWSGGATSSTSRTYSLTKADRGKTLTFEVTAKNASGTLGNTQSTAATKRVSIYKLFLKPDKQKYTRMEPPLVPGNDDMAEMECRYNGAELPTRSELTTLFNDETSRGTNIELCSKYDWPMNAKCGGSGDESRYWTGEKASAGKEAYHVNLTNGQVSQTYIGNAFYVACIKR